MNSTALPLIQDPLIPSTVHNNNLKKKSSTILDLVLFKEKSLFSLSYDLSFNKMTHFLKRCPTLSEQRGIQAKTSAR